MLDNWDRDGIAGEFSSCWMAGATIHVTMGADQIRTPSCAQQRLCVNKLLRQEVERHQWSPELSQYACLHAKTTTC